MIRDESLDNIDSLSVWDKLICERVLRVDFGISFFFDLDLVAAGCDIDDLAIGGGISWVSLGKESINRGLTLGGMMLISDVSVSLSDGRLFECWNTSPVSLFSDWIWVESVNIFLKW